MHPLPSTILFKTRRNVLFLLIPLFGLIFCNNLQAQFSHQIFQHITVSDGLSSNKVTAILQDREGFYWIATQNGLNRFDGTTFTPYYQVPGDSSTLPHNNCTALIEDMHGRIWVTTLGGLCRYDKQRRKFEHIVLPSPKTISQGHLQPSTLSTDGVHTIWISGNGLWRYDLRTDTITYIAPDTSRTEAPSSYDHVRHIVYDPSLQGWWMAMGDELNFFDGRTNQFFHSAHNPRQWKIFSEALPGPIAVDEQSRLWFLDRYEKNLGVFDVQNNTLQLNRKSLPRHVMNMQTDQEGRVWIFYWSDDSEIYDPEKNETLRDFFSKEHAHSVLSSRVNGIFTDRDGHIWINSGEGIDIYHPLKQYYKIYPYSLQSFTDQSAAATVYGLAQTDAGRIWMATDLGLFSYHLTTGTMVKKELPVRSAMVSKDQLPHTSTAVTAITSHDHMLYLGIQDQLIGYDAVKEKVVFQMTLLPNIQFIRTDERGIVWVGMWVNGVFRVDPKLKTARHITAGTDLVHQLKTNGLVSGCIIDQTLWLGYNGGHGFASLDLTREVVEHHMPIIQGKTTYAQGTITAIAGNKDRLWLGTYGDGLLDFNRASGTYTVYHQGEGLNSNYIQQFFFDAYERLWISTTDGLCLFDPATRRIQALDIVSGFPDIEYVESGCRGINGDLFFFDREKVIAIDPSAYRFDSSFAHIVVSRFSVFDEDMTMPGGNEPISLKYDQNFFSFTYSAIKARPDKKIHYGYMLEGFDPQWVETTSTYAGYTNVPPGHYWFKVRTANDAGVWSEPLWQREIIIVPPFWKTGWFVVLAVLTFASLLYAVHRYRIAQVKKIYSIRTQISRDLHDDIGASLSSIHIYSTVAEEEITQDPLKAKSFLQRINANSRQVMEDISDIVWANRLQHDHHASLDARIKNYGYELLAQKNISCTYRIEQEAEEKITRPEARRSILLIIKEALNNMAKYSDARHAGIELTLNGKHIRLQVYDDGRGFDPGHTTGGNGLIHIRKRTEALSGKLTISSSPQSGTALICEIPLTNISDKLK